MDTLFIQTLDLPASKRLGWRLVAAGLLALAAAGALYLALCHVPGGRGWQYRRWTNSAFEGKPAENSVVPEPFEKDEPSEPFSAEWRAWIRVADAGSYEFAVEADDQFRLAVDGKPAVERGEKAGRRMASAVLVLTAADAHEVTLRVTDFGGGKYLRLFLHRKDGAHGWGPLPFPRDIAWPTQEAALAAQPRADTRGRTDAFGGALVLAFAGVLLLACGLRLRAGRPVALADVILLGAVFATAFVARSVDLDAIDIHWDEGAYLHSGLHYVRNLQLGDFAAQSFRWNFEHPPIAKWVYGFAGLGGGKLGGKIFAAYLQALTCVLLFLIGRRYASRAVGATAGIALALMPYFLAHGRITGLEAPVTFFFTLSALLLMLACERRSWPLHLAWGFTSVLGVGSRATGVWFAPVAAVLIAATSGLHFRRWGKALAAFPGAVAGLGLIVLGWPWIWSNTYGQLEQTYAHWSRFRPSEWVLGTFAQPPVWYYGFALLVATPALLLGFALAGVAGAAWRRRLVDLLAICWLIMPLGQSLAPMRQDGARYVIQAFPALALLAALGIDDLALSLGRPRLASWAAAPLAVYLAACCLYMHPYELDFCSEWTGGPGAVARKKWLELPFWGEGERELAAQINAVAPPGATVRVQLIPRDDFPGLRPDLVERSDGGAEFVVMNRFQYPEPPAGYVLIREVRAGGAQLGGVFRKLQRE